MALNQPLQFVCREHIAQRRAGTLRKLPAKPADLIE